MTASPPEWDRLPHDPEGFFGLSQPYDLRALKRCYNALLKQFKPEKYPDEFKQLRSAYETLARRLRWNAPDDDPAPPSALSPATGSGAGDETPAVDATAPIPSTSDAPPPPDSSERRSAKRSRPRPNPAKQVLDRLRHCDPSMVLEELLQADPTEPEAYVIRAVVSDLVEGNPRRQFAMMLIDGLMRFPNDDQLRDWLAGYCQFETQLDEVAAVVVHAAGVLPVDAMSATHALWTRWIDGKVAFDQIATTFAALVAQGCHRPIGEQLAILLPILRRLSWLAPIPWLLAQIKHLHTFRKGVPDELGSEIQLLALVAGYRQARQAVELPEWILFDRVVEDWVTQCAGNYAHEVWTLMQQIALCENLCQDLFAGPEPLATIAFSLLRSMIERSSPWFSIDTLDADPSQITRLAERLCPDSKLNFFGILFRPQPYMELPITRDTIDGFTVIVFLFTIPVTLSLFFLANTFAPSVIWFRELGVITYLGVGMSINTALTCGFLLLRSQIARIILRFAGRQEAIYRKKWRPKLFQALQGRHLPWDDFVQAVASRFATVFPHAPWLGEMLRHDRALEAYCLAQRYLT